jgi:hypothetical protein
MRALAAARSMPVGCGQSIPIMENAPMSSNQYNYSEFVASPNEFFDFAVHAPKVTMRAPSFPLEDLATGKTVQMSELWSSGVAVLEFGSFT